MSANEPTRAVVAPVANTSENATKLDTSSVFSEEKELRAPIEYILPPLTILAAPSPPAMSDEEVRDKSRIIENTLAQFGLPVEVSEVRVGPAVTQFGVTPGFLERGGTTGRKVRVNQISALADDLALALAAPRLRVEAPVPGRSIVGIEVPNNQIQMVGIREVVDTVEFEKLGTPLAFAVGRDVSGTPVVADLAKMPHLLIAGTTGSGKSVCIKAITACLISNNTPDELRLVMIDPKMVELVRFNGLPHLLGRVEVDLERVVKVLRWVALEMDSRYKQFAAATARNLEDYNELMTAKGQPALPRIVVLVDELADLMMMAPDEVEKLICRIAQMARATGIHLVLATQRPSVDVVTGLIKANFPARISFATVSQTDSRVILDMQGAETLLGKGDMLYMASDAGHPARVQGCFVSEDELENLVQFWRDQTGPVKEKAPWERMISGPDGASSDTSHDSDTDDLLQQAINLVQRTGSASASLLQRRLHIGHPRAARLMEEMEEIGIVGPPEAAGRRRSVLINGDE
jgi:S-DNA-T family DNA segregation ATPase FtsK/SpoIIIE